MRALISLQSHRPSPRRKATQDQECGCYVSRERKDGACIDALVGSGRGEFMWGHGDGEYVRGHADKKGTHTYIRAPCVASWVPISRAAESLWSSIAGAS